MKHTITTSKQSWKYYFIRKRNKPVKEEEVLEIPMLWYYGRVQLRKLERYTSKYTCASIAGLKETRLRSIAIKHLQEPVSCLHQLLKQITSIVFFFASRAWCERRRSDLQTEIQKKRRDTIKMNFNAVTTALLILPCIVYVSSERSTNVQCGQR